jgi:hypothetical protein
MSKPKPPTVESRPLRWLTVPGATPRLTDDMIRMCEQLNLSHWDAAWLPWCERVVFA